MDNVSVTEHSNHSVLSQNQSPRICTLAKCWYVCSKQLKEAYKERVSRQAEPVTSLPLSPTVSSTQRVENAEKIQREAEEVKRAHQRE